MKFKAKIIVDGDENIPKLFEAETKEFQNKRAFYNIITTGRKSEFIIEAEDATALRAVLNSITKNISVYEKLKWNKQQKKK